MPDFRSYDSTRLWYRTLGSGPPLVCLAGGPGADARTLGDLGGITARRTLILLDARAAGRSDIPADRDSCAFTRQADDVAALCRHLGLDRPDLLAHSAGTLTAQAYAARHGTGHLALVAPAGRLARERDQDEVAAIRATGIRTSEPDESDYSDPPSWLRDAFYGGATTSGASRSARLAAVTCPVLVIAGAADDISGTAPAHLVAAACPNARAEILPGCGHFPWMDAPTTFRTTVLHFLSTPPATAPLR